MLKTCLLMLLLFTTACGSAAHITDKLVVGLYDGPESRGQPIRLLSSGLPLEVLERRDGFVRVRLSDSTEGWVEASYVTEEKPAKAILLETQARLRQMGLELAALREKSAAGEPDEFTRALDGDAGRTALAEAEQRIAELQRQLAARPAAAEAQRRLQELQRRVDAALQLLGANGHAGPGALSPEVPWLGRYQTWMLALGALLLGFGGGIAFVRQRIRRRYGGLQI